MPAVTQTWLLLILLTLAPSAPRDASPAEGSGRSRVGALIMAVTGFAMAWGCFSTSYWPVMQRKHLVEAAELAASRGGDQETSGRLYRQASEADDLAWEAWESLAMWEFAQAQRSPANKDRTKFEAAIHAESEAIRRAPYRPYGYQLLADFWSTLARQTRRPDDWNEAVTAYRMATDRHPTSARLQADFAITLAEAGHASDAAQAARRAMIQDDLNHRRGHADRYLPQKLREQLAKLADTSPSDAAQNP